MIPKALSLPPSSFLSLGLLGLVFGLALASAAPAGAATLLVGNKAEATVSLIELPGGKVVATLPTGAGPHEIAVSPDGRRALVANYGARQPGSSLTVIDVPAAEVTATLDLGEYRRPHGLVWLDDRRAVVTAEGNQALLVVDVDAGKVARAIATGQEVSHMVAVTPDGSRAFVANIGSGNMTAIDLAKGEVAGHVKTGAGAEGIEVTPDGRQVWVTNREADTVTVVDARTLQVLGTVESASFPIRAKATPDGRHMLVSNARSGDLSVFTVADRKLARRVSLAAEAKKDQEGRLMAGPGFAGSVPIGILVEPGGERAYVAHANADAISVVDLSAWQRTGTLTAGREPDGMGYSKLDVKKKP
jgi:YVTN family beta-propeller protein